MGLFQRLGLSRKPLSRLGTYELVRRRKRRPGKEYSRQDVLARVVIFGGLLVLTVLMFPQAETYEFGMRVRVGDIWQREDVIAPFSFPVLKSEEQLQAERDSIRYEEPPVFARVPDAHARTAAQLDSLHARIQRVLDAYVDWQQSRIAGDAEQARADSARYAAAVDFSNLHLSPAQWHILILSYAARQGIGAAPRPPRGPPLHDELTRDVRAIAERLLPLGVLDVPIDTVLTPQIAVVDLRDRTEGMLMRTDVLGRDQALVQARNELNARYRGRADTVSVGIYLFDRALQPSLRFLRGETEARWAEREARISRRVGMVQEGEAIVRRGDYVTADVQRRLESLAMTQAELRGGIGPWRILAGQLILVVSAYLVFFLYLFLLRRPIYDETKFLLLIAILFAIVVSFFGVIARLPTVPSLAVPVALASILITVTFDSRVGMFATVTLAALGGLIFGYDFEFTFATLVAGMLAVFSMRDVKNRSQILLTAGIVFIAYLAMLGGFTMLRASGLGRLAQDLMLVGINSALLLLAYPFLWICERTFGITTDLSLLELSDTNRPLLRDLSTRAPGTFSHSIQVANLAEAAANAIGANALLARVGALYHDIGKMLRPSYYIENQQPGENPHDDITPYMSALIIAEHVKAGQDLGREANLPEVVINFIPTHHGTTLMEYFYRKAQELEGEGDGRVDATEFRYPGPIPQTNEQGIVMLADSVEAASRSLERPNRKRLEALIESIIQARIQDGQLSQTQLTFSDLDRIKDTFLSILGGIYHFRVKYPEQEEEPEVAPLAEEPMRAAAAVSPSSHERASMG